MAGTSFRRLMCHKLTSNFKEAVRIEAASLKDFEPKEGEVLVRNKFVGINASDVNFTAGHYDPTAKPPFPTGFEAVGEVVKTGSGVNKYKPGQAVGYMNFGAFAEYKTIDAALLIPVPEAKPEFIPLMVSGLTATLALDKVGDIKASDTVLVTAAAGGTGQFAVQWAKSKGCKVLGTCSSPDKVEFLKSIGCDRPINYKTENLSDVLKAECPKGVDVVYECIGGQMFETCVKHLAEHGRLVIIGMIESYQEGIVKAHQDNIEFIGSVPLRLLKSSASLRGFFLPHFAQHFPEYMGKMIGGVKMGTLLSKVDNGTSTGKPFKELEDVERAVQFMFDKGNVGKVVVELNCTESSRM